MKVVDKVLKQDAAVVKKAMASKEVEEHIFGVKGAKYNHEIEINLSGISYVANMFLYLPFFVTFLFLWYKYLS